MCGDVSAAQMCLGIPGWEVCEAAASGALLTSDVTGHHTPIGWVPFYPSQSQLTARTTEKAFPNKIIVVLTRWPMIPPEAQ